MFGLPAIGALAILTYAAFIVLIALAWRAKRRRDIDAVAVRTDAVALHHHGHELDVTHLRDACLMMMLQTAVANAILCDETPPEIPDVIEIDRELRGILGRFPATDQALYAARVTDAVVKWCAQRIGFIA